ncbi:MAG: DUF3471 domain-containing protein, partial [Chitinophagaceae bacterium]|nr:DUF3471 domain-containing protein [Chitinophagaceae bacterium]
FTVAIMANRADANPTNMAFKVAKIFLQDKFVQEEKKEKTTEEQPKEQVALFTKEQMTGTYTIQPGADMEISIKNDSLNFKQSWNNATSNLATTGGNKYTIPGVNDISFTFTDLKDGKTQTLSIEQDGDVTDCKRKKDISLSATQQKEYTGNYYSAELDITYNVYLEEGKLKIKINDDEGTDMELYDTDGFTSEGLTFRFKRKEGKVTGFELDAGRVKNIRFEKKS